MIICLCRALNAFAAEANGVETCFRELPVACLIKMGTVFLSFTFISSIVLGMIRLVQSYIPLLYCMNSSAVQCNPSVYCIHMWYKGSHLVPLCGDEKKCSGGGWYVLFLFRGRLLSPPVIPPFTDDNKAHLISARVEKEEEEEDEGASLPDLTTRGPQTNGRTTLSRRRKGEEIRVGWMVGGGGSPFFSCPSLRHDLP